MSHLHYIAMQGPPPPPPTKYPIVFTLKNGGSDGDIGFWDGDGSSGIHWVSPAFSGFHGEVPFFFNNPVWMPDNLNVMFRYSGSILELPEPRAMTLGPLVPPTLSTEQTSIFYDGIYRCNSNNGGSLHVLYFDNETTGVPCGVSGDGTKFLLLSGPGGFGGDSASPYSLAVYTMAGEFVEQIVGPTHDETVLTTEGGAIWAPQMQGMYGGDAYIYHSRPPGAPSGLSVNVLDFGTEQLVVAGDASTKQKATAWYSAPSAVMVENESGGLSTYLQFGVAPFWRPLNDFPDWPSSSQAGSLGKLNPPTFTNETDEQFVASIDNGAEIAVFGNPTGGGSSGQVASVSVSAEGVVSGMDFYRKIVLLG